jgi:hypothetical protein
MYGVRRPQAQPKARSLHLHRPPLVARPSGGRRVSWGNPTRAPRGIEAANCRPLPAGAPVSPALRASIPSRYGQRNLPDQLHPVRAPCPEHVESGLGGCFCFGEGLLQ